MNDTKPKTARSYRGSVVDDNAIISINIKWLIQMCILIAGLVYSYYQIVYRIGELERRVSNSDNTITELVEKHIEEENKRYEQMEEDLKWHQKLLKKKKK
tara:strand:+ start:833 stop:1132 length:300 start_codon:yes stop_codon:yes gene_type:complete